jgi:hypothetical protein
VRALPDEAHAVRIGGAIEAHNDRPQSSKGAAMANGDPLRAGQVLDAEDTTILDARPFPGIGAGLLVRNYVFRIGAPTIPVPWSPDFIGIQAEGPTGVLGMSFNSRGPGVAGVGRSSGATGVYGSGGDQAVWGNGIPTVLPNGISQGSLIGVIGDAVDTAGVFGLSWFGCGVLGRNQEGQKPGVRGEGSSSAGVEGVSDAAPGVFGESISGMGTGGRSVRNSGVSGISSEGAGVRGFSDRLVGVQGSSERGKGVEGTGSTIGVHGSSTTGQGVVGQAGRGIGVHALSDGLALLAEGRRFAADLRGDVVVRGRFLVTGAKSAVVPAPGGGLQQLYCVEAPEPWFEDLGEAVLVDGQARVELDPRYAAAIAGKYQVHLTPYGAALLWVAERKADHFVVRTTALAGVRSARSVRFCWRVVARRGDIKGPRFAKVELPDLEVAVPVPVRTAKVTAPAALARIDVKPRTESALGQALATPQAIASRRRRS